MMALETAPVLKIRDTPVQRRAAPISSVAAEDARATHSACPRFQLPFTMFWTRPWHGRVKRVTRGYPCQQPTLARDLILKVPIEPSGGPVPGSKSGPVPGSQYHGNETITAMTRA